MREGRAEPCPYGVGGCKREIQRKQKGDTKEKGKRKKKQAVSAIIRESGAFWERPKRTGVKRRVKAERPEPALSERSEFRRRQRSLRPE